MGKSILQNIFDYYQSEKPIAVSYPKISRNYLIFYSNHSAAVYNLELY